MIRNPLEHGKEGFFRRIPIIFHILIVAAFLSIFQISGSQYKALLLSFNESAGLDWASIISAIILLVGYLFTLILLASTKVLVEWLVDGK